MRVFFTFLFLLVSMNIIIAQASLPLSRTIWNSTPTGWTDSGTSSYSSTFACSGSNMGQLNDNGDSYQVFFSSSPKFLDFVIKITSTATSSCLIEQSVDGISWSQVANISTLPTTCTGYNYTLINTTRYVKWTYNKVAQNLGLDDVTISAAPMPIQIKHFAATKQSSSTKLNLITASETNNDYFTIERSADGRNFDAIGEIKGAGNSNQELSYEFVDESPLAGINYYRIKQTDFDGTYSYTEIRSVRHQTKNVIVSPNRTDGKLNVTSELDNYDVVIYNTGGQEVQRHMALSGDQSLSIETLQAGVYFVKVMDQTIRILKF